MARRRADQTVEGGNRACRTTARPAAKCCRARSCRRAVVPKRAADDIVTVCQYRDSAADVIAQCRADERIGGGNRPRATARPAAECYRADIVCRAVPKLITDDIVAIAQCRQYSSVRFTRRRADQTVRRGNRAAATRRAAAKCYRARINRADIVPSRCIHEKVAIGKIRDSEIADNIVRRRTDERIRCGHDLVSAAVCRGIAECYRARPRCRAVPTKAADDVVAVRKRDNAVVADFIVRRRTDERIGGRNRSVAANGRAAQRYRPDIERPGKTVPAVGANDKVISARQNDDWVIADTIAQRAALKSTYQRKRRAVIQKHRSDTPDAALAVKRVGNDKIPVRQSNHLHPKRCGARWSRDVCRLSMRYDGSRQDHE